MKRHRHTPEQIVRKLREGDRLLNVGKDLTEVLRHLEVSESSWNRWRSQYGGMKANEAKRLRELESENARLKKLLAEAELDKAMLKELAEGSLHQRGPSSWRIRVFAGRDESGKKRYLERTLRGTKREAQRVMARLVTEVDEGRHVAASSTRFGEVLDRWLEIKATVVEPTTLASYRWIATTYVVPALGSLPLDKIRALDLDRFYARLRAAGRVTAASCRRGRFGCATPSCARRSTRHAGGGWSRETSLLTRRSRSRARARSSRPPSTRSGTCSSPRSRSTPSSRSTSGCSPRRDAAGSRTSRSGGPTSSSRPASSGSAGRSPSSKGR
jgi:hypothetical protein